jgi:hypothetical protein
MAGAQKKKKKVTKSKPFKPRAATPAGPPPVKFWVAYSDSDTPDESMEMEAASLPAVEKEVCEMYGLSPAEFKQEGHSIEVKKNGEWKALQSMDDLKSSGKGPSGACLRVPAFFEGEGGDYPGGELGGEGGEAGYPGGEGGYPGGEGGFPGTEGSYPGGDEPFPGKNGDFLGPSVEDAFHNVLNDMKSKGYRPKSFLTFDREGTSNKLVMTRDGVDVCTKQAVLDMAADNAELREVLLNRIGSLQHIAESLHYPFTWEEPSPDAAAPSLDK